MIIANVKLEPWIRKYSVYFEQDQTDLARRGETPEQYQAYKLWVQQLEVQLNDFVHREGFASASDCFDAMQEAVQRDRKRHEDAVTALVTQAKKSAADALTAGIVFMLLPVSSDDLLDLALRVAEYPTFSKLMRTFASHVQCRNQV